VESIEQFDSLNCQVMVLGHNRMNLLLVVENGLLLPSVEVPRWQRVAENLRAAMKSEWDCEVVCLFTPQLTLPDGPWNVAHYQVMESWNATETHDPRTAWIPICSLAEDSFNDAADYLSIRQSLAQCEAYADDPAAPFAKSRWFKELQAWIAEVTRPLAIQLTGSFRQLNASPSFSLVRFETNGPAIWFKAVGEPNQREFPITLKLAQLFPEYVPAVLGTRSAWNGWLSLEAEGTNLSETREIALWEAAAVALARLQIESISKVAPIIHSGARDLRVDTLSVLLHPFLDDVGRLMDQQIKIPPAVLDRKQLDHLEERIGNALGAIEELGIPDTLGHLDLNPGNIIVCSDGCVFLDWAEAYVGHPFFSFEYLLEHFRRAAGADKTIEERLIASYAAEWEQLVSPASTAEALGAIPLLGVFAYAAGCGMSTDRESLQDPKIAGYLRALTRRMGREANHLISRRPQCRT
jgi:hypothetical protein